MQLFIVYVLSTLMLVCSSISQEETEKLHITVLYESFCPDSRYFISSQLKNNYDGFKDYINLKLVPFGKARSIPNSENFECQHGEKECRGNKIHSCVLNELPNQIDKQVEFINCQMQGIDFSGHMCASNVGVNIENLENCLNDGTGRQLQLIAENETNSYPHDFIPTIIFNQEYNASYQFRAFNDLRELLCQLLNEEPPSCRINY